MKIGMTGATGFLGGHIIKRLQKDGHTIKAFVIEEKPNLPEDVDWVHGDLSTGNGLPEFLNGVDVLVHLAARIVPPDEEMMEGNVITAHNLVAEALKYPIKQIVFTSSVAVYGKDKQSLTSLKQSLPLRGKKEKFKEMDNCSPNTMYGLTKFLAEKVIQYWSTMTGNPATIFRPFNIFGPGNAKGVIYQFYSDIKNNGRVVVYGDGTQERDYLYVGDIVEVFSKVISQKKGGIFNLGNPKKHSVLQILSVFEKVMNKKIKIEFSPNEQGKVFNVNQNLSFVKKELEWEATTSFEDGLRKTIQWYEKH